MDFKERLIEHGLTVQQANAKAVDVLEQLLAEDKGIETEIVNEYLLKITSRLKETQLLLNQRNYELCSLKNAMEEIDKKVSLYTASAEKEIVNDPKMLDTLNFYSALLKRTQDVFGAEKMTEAVIIQLLETASYGIWRSIMGGKYEEQSSPTKAGSKLVIGGKRQ